MTAKAEYKAVRKEASLDLSNDLCMSLSLPPILLLILFLKANVAKRKMIQAKLKEEGML